MFHFLRTVRHPDRYHGQLRGQKPPFFEGWYFKVIDPSEKHRYAIIAGVIWSGRSHAFTQVLEGATARATYHEFPLTDFQSAEDRFDIRIGDSQFMAHGISPQIDRPEQRVSGALQFDGLSPWPVTWAAPGIMGWYAWVPFMECYHGVVSLDHAVAGELTIDGQTIDFTGGRGYIEKDWGSSFPEAWIWFQSNHFVQPRTCLTASIAIIPWLRSAFPGFIIGLWHAGRLKRLATYTGAKTEHLRVTEHTIDWVVSDNDHRLEMFVRQGPESTFGLLRGPDRAEMGKRVAETLSAEVDVRFTTRSGAASVLFEGTGRHAGLEVHEVENRLLKMIA